LVCGQLLQQDVHATPQGDFDHRRRELAISRMQADPALAARLKPLLAE
jgi:hypothetical protein